MDYTKSFEVSLLIETSCRVVVAVLTVCDFSGVFGDGDHCWGC